MSWYANLTLLERFKKLFKNITEIIFHIFPVVFFAGMKLHIGNMAQIPAENNNGKMWKRTREIYLNSL